MTTPRLRVFAARFRGLIRAYRKRPTFAAAGDVTEFDIRFAYRLLLDRDPDPDGWRTYSAMLGKPLRQTLVASILGSEEFRHSALHHTVVRHEHHGLVLATLDGDLRLFVSPYDFSNSSILRTGTYEPHLCVALDECLAPGATFCAVGANLGYHTVRAAARVGTDGHVFAFEAHPANAQLIRRSILANGIRNTLVLPFAVADGRGFFEYVPAQGTNGYIRPITSATESDPSSLADALVVQSVRLDDFHSLLSGVNVVQMDVEGAEGLVLRGALKLIATARPVIFSELSLGQLERISGVSGSSFLAPLRRLGYSFAALEIDGTRRQFGADVDSLIRYAEHQAGSHIDIQCSPPAP